MLVVSLLVLLVAKDCRSQDDEGPYRGKLLGKLNSYHHQVSGEVYAVDEWTLLLVDFHYDGLGGDTFFWSGDNGRPGPLGFIIPNEHGKTNILERYAGAELRLRLPEGKRVSQLKWLSIYDLATQNSFADLEFPEELDVPRARTLHPLAGSKAVSSGPVKVLNSNTLLISALKYDGSGKEVYFTAGVGPQPSPKGIRIPDELGYLEPLGPYNGSDVTLTLPGSLTVDGLSWLSLWDHGSSRSLGSVPLRDTAAVPPASIHMLPYKSSLPFCRQLHREVQVSWEVFGHQLTVEMAAKLGPSEYVSFGRSNSSSSSMMEGADVVVATFHDQQQRPLLDDYQISDKAPCGLVLGALRGVCRDELIGGVNNKQLLSGSRKDGLTVITYRLSVTPEESLDLAWSLDALIPIVWAVGGSSASDRAPSMHRLFNRATVLFNLSDSNANDCFQFTTESVAPVAPWPTVQLWDPAKRVFVATIGPAPPSATRTPLAWFVDGQLAPDLVLRRGLHYTIKVSGGNDPHSATLYHPLVVSTSLFSNGTVLAGVTTTRRGRDTPTAAGPLCMGVAPPSMDIRRLWGLPSFRAFNRTLGWSCSSSASAPPASLQLAPDHTWPDTVYYRSFTWPEMSGRILVVDSYRKTSSRRNGCAHLDASFATTLVFLATLLVFRASK